MGAFDLLKDVLWPGATACTAYVVYRAGQRRDLHGMTLAEERRSEALRTLVYSESVAFVKDLSVLAFHAVRLCHAYVDAVYAVSSPPCDHRGDLLCESDELDRISRESRLALIAQHDKLRELHVRAYSVLPQASLEAFLKFRVAVFRTLTSPSPAMHDQVMATDEQYDLLSKSFRHVLGAEPLTAQIADVIGVVRSSGELASAAGEPKQAS